MAAAEAIRLDRRRPTPFPVRQSGARFEETDSRRPLHACLTTDTLLGPSDWLGMAIERARYHRRRSDTVPLRGM
ncbi:MAG: hypothetical protein INR70_12485 [Parafilimonas terrae]|nr:hypothetical protein [Parafilimonas terrae]